MANAQKMLEALEANRAKAIAKQKETQANVAPSGTSGMADFRQLDQASLSQPIPKYTPQNQTVGENAFLVNAFPIKQSDNVAVKGVKGLGNIALSTLDAPFELARKLSLQGGSILTGQGIQKDLPKNTTFAKDLLFPALGQNAQKSFESFQEKRPTLGGLAEMVIDTIADPSLYFGVGVGKNLASKSKELGILGKDFKRTSTVKQLDEVMDEPPDIELKIDKPEYAPWVREDLINANNVAREKNIIKSLTAEQNPFEGMYENRSSQGINPAVSRYDELIKKEIARLKEEGGQGVLPGGLGRDAEGDVVMAWGRQSLNPKWYRELYKANASELNPVGKKPTAEQYKALAIENLRKGAERFDGEAIPANFEFLRLEKELSSGKTIPKEWEGLEQVIKETEVNPSYMPDEAESVIATFRAEQERIIQEAQGRIDSRAEARKNWSELGSIGKSGYNPLDDVADLVRIGAGKISLKGLQYAEWAKEMLSEYGEIIKENLPYIWHRAKELNLHGETKIKFEGAEILVKQADSELTKGNLQENIKKATTGKIEPSQVKWDGVSPLPEPQSKIILGKEKSPFSFKETWNKFYKSVVDTQNPIMQADESIGKVANASRNASGISKYVFMEGMVDKTGKRIGDSLKTVVENVPKGKEESFWTYMSQRHNIARAREGKPVQANYSSEMSAEATRIAEQANPEFKAAGDSIVKWIDDFMQTWGVDTGIVNKEIYASLRQIYPDYFPTQRQFSELEKSIPDGLSQKFADMNTPVKKAKGSERDISNPVENIMHLVDRTVRTAKFNEVGQALLRQVRENPAKMQKWAEEVPVKEGMFANTDNVVSVLENGKPSYLRINDKMLLESMTGLPKAVKDIPGLTSATQLVKDTITTKNPLFGVFNAARDIPTGYILGSEMNPAKFLGDLGKAGKDIVTNSPRYQQYRGLGAGDSHFFTAGAEKSASDLTGQKAAWKKILNAAGDAANDFNNIIETMPRLAEFNRILDKTGDINEALYAAAEVTVNFGRSGNVSKALDKAGGMYVNAGVQGVDRFFRAFKDPKTALQTLVKAGIAITVPDVSLYLVNKDNPHYKDLNNRNKDTYFCIPNYANVDKDGNPQTFFKLPKSREFGVLFGALFDRTMRAISGEKESFKGFGNIVSTNFAPASPIENNLLTPALINLQRNKDFADRPIVPLGMELDKRHPYLQKDETTTLIAEKIGELSAKALGEENSLSPKQIDYLIKSYTGIIGQIVQPLTTPGGKPRDVLTRKFIADPVFSNQASEDFYDKLGKLSAKVSSRNIETEGNLNEAELNEKDMSNSMQGISSALSKASKQVKKFNTTNDDAQVKAIKTDMLGLMKKANKAKSPEEMQAIEDEAKKLFPDAKKKKANSGYFKPW